MKKTLGIVMILIVAFSVTMIGLAADQTVTVNIPSVSTLTVVNTASITFPAIDSAEWGNGESFTASSANFDVVTRYNGPGNPVVQVSSSALTNSAGATLPLGQFLVYLAPQGQTATSAALSGPVTFSNIGKGRKTATAHYALTLNADQQSGTYTGTVTYTLSNL